MKIFKGEQIAQLLLLPCIQGKSTNEKRRWLWEYQCPRVFGEQLITEKRPTMIATFEDGTKLGGMLDSGADVTVTAHEMEKGVYRWQPFRVWGTSLTQQSARALKGADPDGY